MEVKPFLNPLTATTLEIVHIRISLLDSTSPARLRAHYCGFDRLGPLGFDSPNIAQRHALP